MLKILFPLNKFKQHKQLMLWDAQVVQAAQVCVLADAEALAEAGADNMREHHIHTKFVTLVLTHRCNLNCSYCYEKHKDFKDMTFNRAIEILDKELTAVDDFKAVEIDLFGGEPLLKYDLIVKIVEYTRQRNYNIPFLFFITTNGTLLTDDMKAWFRNNVDLVQMSLSLDGTRSMHNLNRSNSYDLIDIDFFHDTYPWQSVKMTVSLNTLSQMSEGVIESHKKGFDVICDLAYGIDWHDSENSNILSNELQKLIDFYLENLQINPCSMLDVERLINVSLPNDKSIRMCGAGYSMRDYDCDGTLYPCQHFLPICVGEEKAKESLNIDFSSLEIDENKIDIECRNCILKNVCTTCYGANYEATGNIYKRDKNMCLLIKTELKATAYFAIRLLEAGCLDFPEDKQVSIVSSALQINNLV